MTEQTDNESAEEQRHSEIAQRQELEHLILSLSKRGLGWRQLEPLFQRFGATTYHDLAPEHRAEAINRLKVMLATMPRRKNKQQQINRTNGKATLHIINAADVKPENIEYVWHPRLARGKHTALAGAGGKGKSQLAYAIAAVITKGLFFCDGARAPKGTVIILSAEEGAKDMIVPRLIAAKANLAKVKIIEAVRDDSGEHKFNLQADIEVLKAECQKIGDVVLIVFDPISSYMGGATLDTHRNSAVRSVLDPVNKLAEDIGCAILSISHFNKGDSKTAINRVMESAAFVNAPRAAFGVFDHPDFISDDLVSPRYVLAPLKSNIGKLAQSLLYHVEEVDTRRIDSRGNPILAPRVVWDGVVEITANEIAQREHGIGDNGERPTPERDRAVDWLRGYLALGPRDASETKAAAELEQSISAKTLRNAREHIGVVSKQVGPHKFTWELPQSG